MGDVIRDPNPRLHMHRARTASSHQHNTRTSHVHVGHLLQKMFVDGEVSSSQRKTPPSTRVPMIGYANDYVCTISLIRATAESEALQSWYADDANAAGKIPRVRGSERGGISSCSETQSLGAVPMLRSL